eukprot:TRINITY_DN16861_c0_g1_i1.p1 TRINITY_DN16861_c0_g1~~TRINITY_DN16861_c0_g1_i1.p1  ORF type:complete len:335 (-),score=72.16 TRINITY_DN16861_c0_g1_i1:48-1052(-)
MASSSPALPRITVNDLHERGTAALEAARSASGGLLVSLPAEEAEVLHAAFRASWSFFDGSGCDDAQKRGLKGYKLMKHKERIQWTRAHLDGEAHGAAAAAVAPDLARTMSRAYVLLRGLAEAAVRVAVAATEDTRRNVHQSTESCVSSGDAGSRPVMESAVAADAQGAPCCDALEKLESHYAEGRASVLNAYKYLNELEYDDLNCRAHIDPGLATVLCRATQPGLQLLVGGTRQSEGEAGASATFGDYATLGDEVGGGGGGRWLDCEECMEPDDVLVIWGESLQRAAGGCLHGCLHRVAKPVQPGIPRLSVAYELRPDRPIYAPWWQDAATRSS